MILADGTFQTAPVACPQRQAAPVRKHAASFSDTRDVVNVDSYSTVDPQKARVTVDCVKESVEFHPYARFAAVCALDAHIVRIAYHTADVLEAQLHVLPRTDKLHCRTVYGKDAQRVTKNVCKAIRPERFVQIIECMTGKGVRHVFRARCQEDKKTCRIVGPKPSCAFSAIHAAHEDVHQNDVVLMGWPGSNELLAGAEQCIFCPAVMRASEFRKHLLCAVAYFIVIVNYGDAKIALYTHLFCTEGTSSQAQ